MEIWFFEVTIPEVSEDIDMRYIKPLELSLIDRIEPHSSSAEIGRIQFEFDTRHAY